MCGKLDFITMYFSHICVHSTMFIADIEYSKLYATHVDKNIVLLSILRLTFSIKVLCYFGEKCGT